MGILIEKSMRAYPNEGAPLELSREEMKAQIEFVEKQIFRGLQEQNPFWLLEAENKLMSIGSYKPSEKILGLVLKRIDRPEYHLDLDLIRLCGYLIDDRLVDVLEKHFIDLKDVWREQDEIRLYESQKIMLENVLCRASELSSLRILADPYISTLDEFFDKVFNDKKISEFSKLVKIRDNLFKIRKDGKLTKENILAVIRTAEGDIDGILKRRMAELEANKRHQLMKPNRLIAVYYCLLDALMTQGSSAIQVDEEFVQKVSQDFRASSGAGTKRFVLNTLLKLKGERFAEIAAEARYGIQAKTVEKLERREAEDPDRRDWGKVSVADFQNFSLFKIAASIIANNPSETIFRTLLQSHNSSSLLLGLRALQEARLSPGHKLRYLKYLFDVGIMDDYAFTRALQILSDIDTPGAVGVVAEIISSRYGWRRPKLSETAIKTVQKVIYSSRSSGSIAEMANALNFEEGGHKPDVLIPPREEELYDAVLSWLSNRFEKNVFHGVNELAQHRLFSALLPVIFRTRVNFSIKGKRRALALLNSLNQVSKKRAGRMVEELREVLGTFESGRLKAAGERDRKFAFEILSEGRKSLSVLSRVANQGTQEDRALTKIVGVLERFIDNESIVNNRLIRVELNQVLKDLFDLGPKRMSQRIKNLQLAATRKGGLDEMMMPVRYPGSSSAIVKTGPLLIRYGKVDNNQLVDPVLTSLGIRRVFPLPSPPKNIPSEDSINELWRKLEPSLLGSIEKSKVHKFALDARLVTAFAVAKGRNDLLDAMELALCEGGQGDLILLSYLAMLPAESEFAERWSRMLAHLNEEMFVSLHLGLRSEDKEKLKSLVPDLLDLLD